MKRQIRRLNMINWYSLLNNDQKALRFLDDLGFINHFECYNKEECHEKGVELFDVDSKWYWKCRN